MVEKEKRNKKLN